MALTNADKLNMRYCAKELFFMGKVDQLVSSLQKLYSKRGALDKQIADAEKKLAVEVKAAAKPAAPAKKPAAKKPAARKPAASKSPVKK
jgi:outer membrane murein-binding lipoprotein Lpp